jgi:hypothetical protein
MVKFDYLFVNSSSLGADIAAHTDDPDSGSPDPNFARDE